MGKRAWILATLTVALLILSACGPTPTEAPTPTATPQPTATQTTATLAPTPDGPVVITTPEAVGTCEAAPLPTVPIRPIDATDWVRGADPTTADVILYEYSDFQCPGCGGMAPIVDLFVEDHPNIALVYRHFPLSFHDRSPLAAEAAEAAGAQGKFWEMHDLLFSRQTEWAAQNVTGDQAREFFNGYADELGLNMEQFNNDMDNHTYQEKINTQAQEAQALQLSGTPSFIYNDIPYPTEQIGLSYSGLESFLEMLDLQAVQWDAIPDMTVDAEGSYQAVISTSKGDITVEMFPQSAPTHVNSFLFLSKEGWYDDSPFFFVRGGYVALGGDPTGSGIGYPGYYCSGEEQGVFDRAGLVGMLANGQFFITLGADAAQLNGQFPLIGQVVAGLDVVQTLTNRSPADATPVAPDTILSIDIQE